MVVVVSTGVLCFVYYQAYIKERQAINDVSHQLQPLQPRFKENPRTIAHSSIARYKNLPSLLDVFIFLSRN